MNSRELRITPTLTAETFEDGEVVLSVVTRHCNTMVGLSVEQVHALIDHMQMQVPKVGRPAILKTRAPVIAPRPLPDLKPGERVPDVFPNAGNKVVAHTQPEKPKKPKDREKPTGWGGAPMKAKRVPVPADEIVCVRDKEPDGWAIKIIRGKKVDKRWYATRTQARNASVTDRVGKNGRVK